MAHPVLLVVGVAVLSGCAAVLVDHAEAWPEEVPSRAYYERVWESDPRLQQLQPREQYLAWVLRFYSGSFLVPGWKEREAQIAAHLSPEQARLVEPDLAFLGQLISSEWSKPDPARRISSKTLAVWGAVMTSARDRDQIIPVLEQIRGDVRSLLEGGLDPTAVTIARYPATAWTKEIPR
jgi:hypothetical protein